MKKSKIKEDYMKSRTAFHELITSYKEELVKQYNIEFGDPDVFRDFSLYFNEYKNMLIISYRTNTNKFMAENFQMRFNESDGTFTEKTSEDILVPIILIDLNNSYVHRLNGYHKNFLDQLEDMIKIYDERVKTVYHTVEELLDKSGKFRYMLLSLFFKKYRKFEFTANLLIEEMKYLKEKIELISNLQLLFNDSYIDRLVNNFKSSLFYGFGNEFQIIVEEDCEKCNKMIMDATNELNTYDPSITNCDCKFTIFDPNN